MTAHQPTPDWMRFAPLLFPFFWAAALLLLSRFGWSRFAAKYPVPMRPSETSYTALVGRFNFFCNYNRVIKIIFTDAGLYASVFFLFRPGHPPFLVPWSNVTAVTRNRVLFQRFFAVRIEDDAGTLLLKMPIECKAELLFFIPVRLDSADLRSPAGYGSAPKVRSSAGSAYR